MEPRELRNLILFVCAKAGIDEESLYRRTREPKVVEARWVLFYVFYHVIGMTSTKAGEILLRDHSAVLYGIRQVFQWKENVNINKRGVELLNATIKFIEQNGY